MSAPAFIFSEVRPKMAGKATSMDLDLSIDFWLQKMVVNALMVMVLPFSGSKKMTSS